MRVIRFLDLFAGAGGLSEGFVRAGYTPIAHVEMDEAACNTLRTRMAYHWLARVGKQYVYNDYLAGKITRDMLYSIVPKDILATVIHKEINNHTLNSLFVSIDQVLNDSTVDVIVGGPPCQAYSLVGRAKDRSNMLFDDRNYLYKFYARFIEHFVPKLFVFENVTGLISAKAPDGSRHLDNMLRLFRSLGYSVEHRSLLSSEYGVPQNRKRVIIIGVLGSHVNFFPDMRTSRCTATISELFADLPHVVSGAGSWGLVETSKQPHPYLTASCVADYSYHVSQHISRKNSDRDLEIYKIAVDKWISSRTRLQYDDLPEVLKTHKNRGMFKDRFKVIDGQSRFSHTVLAHLSKDGHYYIHPDLTQNRSITPREAARLQTFPDNYFFESISTSPNFHSSFQQIGNAVPVILAYEIAQSIKELL